MLLRLVMVGMVASLGFEPPTSRDVDAWGRQGRILWDGLVSSCQFRWLSEEEIAVAEDEEVVSDAPVVAVELTGPPRLDLPVASQGEQAVAAPAPTFEEIVAEMAAVFGEGLQTAEAAKVTFEPLEVGDDLYPGLAYALNRAAEGGPGVVPPEPAAEEPTASAEEAAAAAPASAAVEVMASARAEPTDRTGRLLVAVRLTGQAVQAWANLFRQGTSSFSLRQ